jgi:hypothetical protein
VNVRTDEVVAALTTIASIRFPISRFRVPGSRHILPSCGLVSALLGTRIARSRRRSLVPPHKVDEHPQRRSGGTKPMRARRARSGRANPVKPDRHGVGIAPA